MSYFIWLKHSCNEIIDVSFLTWQVDGSSLANMAGRLMKHQSNTVYKQTSDEKTIPSKM